LRKVDLVLVGKALVGGSLVEAAVAVEGGRIAGVTSPALAPPAEELVELGARRLLLPGMVDLHVHMREPGLEYKEDWRTGSMAAARGGVTCVFDMPNNKPPTNTCERIREKISRAVLRSLVDFGVYAGYNPQPAGLERCSGDFFGFKLYPENLYSSGAEEVFRLAAKLGKPVFVHAEDPSPSEPPPSTRRPGLPRLSYRLPGVRWSSQPSRERGCTSRTSAQPPCSGRLPPPGWRWT